MSTEFLSGIIKGDSITFEIDVGENITDWKIRCELWTDTKSIKKASANVTGGSDAQAKITDTVNGKFEIYIDKGETTDFEDTANIEIEITTDNDKRWTIYANLVKMASERIKWDSI